MAVTIYFKIINSTKYWILILVVSMNKYGGNEPVQCVFYYKNRAEVTQVRRETTQKERERTRVEEKILQ